MHFCTAGTQMNMTDLQHYTAKYTGTNFQMIHLRCILDNKNLLWFLSDTDEVGISETESSSHWSFQKHLTSNFYGRPNLLFLYSVDLLCTFLVVDVMSQSPYGPDCAFFFHYKKKQFSQTTISSNAISVLQITWQRKRQRQRVSEWEWVWVCVCDIRND